MKDRVVLITGSTDGIGKQTAYDIAEKGVHVLLHARDQERGKAAVRALKNVIPEASVDLFCADFTRLSEVRKMAADIQSKYQKLDVLINNAGIMSNVRKLTGDGFEMTFQVNYLAHFLLTKLLLDSFKGDGRIINVSSMVHQSARFDLENLQGEKFFDGYNAYGCSKLENILFTIQLSKILEGSKLTVNSLHPGVVSTKLLKAAMGSGSWGSSLKEGAATSVYLAISDEVKNISGKYFVNSKVRTPSADALDPVIQNKLWEASEKLI